MKRLFYTIVAASAMLLGGMPEAIAHERPYAVAVTHGAFFVRDHRHCPLWLRGHHDFHRWYGRSPHRFDIHLSWYQLFDIYRYERNHYRPHRHHDRHRHH